MLGFLSPNSAIYDAMIFSSIDSIGSKKAGLKRLLVKENNNLCHYVGMHQIHPLCKDRHLRNVHIILFDASSMGYFMITKNFHL